MFYTLYVSISVDIIKTAIIHTHYPETTNATKEKPTHIKYKTVGCISLSGTNLPRSK